MDPILLQSLLDELARDGGNLAELLRTYSTEGRLTVEEADRLEAEAREAFRTLQNAESLTEADIESMQVLADAVDAVRAERTHLVEAAEAQAARVAEIAARVAPVEDTAATDDAEGDQASDGETSTEDLDDAAEVVDLTDDAAEVVAEAEQATQDAAAVTAAGPPATPPVRRRVNVAAIASRTQRPDPSTGQPQGSDLPFGGALVASAGAPGGRTAGQIYQAWSDLGEALSNAWGSMSGSQLRSLVASAESAGVPYRQQTGLATLRMEFPPDLIIDDANMDATAILARAADVNRVGGAEALVAAGWCSPSEQMYDLCDLPCSLDGILSLPEVLASRGGIRYTKGLDFAAIYNGTGYFHFTEAEMMADPRPEKPCMEIPCPEFVECRLDVDGLCITGDIMQNRTYPEVTTQFIQGALCAHAHRVNAFKLAAIAAGSANQGNIGQAGYGAVANVLYAIELQIQAYRYRGRRAQEGNPALLELVAPYWIKGILRADIANRNAPSGIGNPLMVSDADIRNWFASRGVAIQYVYDWQDLETIENDMTGDPTPLTDYPNSVEFLLYEAGTWIVPSLDVITLDTLYDSTLIKQNKYQALFTEQAFCITERCGGSLRFQVNVCANGNTGAQVAVTCA